MTKAMPFLQKVILLSYDPRPFKRGRIVLWSAAVFLIQKSPSALPRCMGKGRRGFLKFVALRAAAVRIASSALS